MTIDGSNLDVSLQEEERWRRRLSVTVPASVVEREHEEAARKLASRMKLKGFRKGKVPPGVVQSRYGDALRQETLERIIGEAYREALAREDLKPISEGELEEVNHQPQQDLVFSISFDVQPLIDISRVGGFTVERPSARVEDAHVQQILDRIREQNGAWKPVEEGAAGDGDLVSVGIRRLDGDEEDAEAQDYEFVLGKGDAIPDIEDAIRTLAPGETGEFHVTFPDDFPNEERRGDEEHLEITLTSRKELELPELDDELVRQVGDFEGLEDLKAKVREDLETDAREQAESVVRGRLLDFVLEANPFQVPRSMVDRYVEAVIDDQVGDQKGNIPPEQLQEIRGNIRSDAEHSVKRMLVLDRIAESHGLQATEDDVDARIEGIAEKNDTDAAKVYATLQKQGRLEVVERELTERKVFEFLKEQSEIVDADGS